MTAGLLAVALCALAVLVVALLDERARRRRAEDDADRALDVAADALDARDQAIDDRDRLITWITTVGVRVDRGQA